MVDLRGQGNFNLKNYRHTATIFPWVKLINYCLLTASVSITAKCGVVISHIITDVG